MNSTGNANRSGFANCIGPMNFFGFAHGFVRLMVSKILFVDDLFCQSFSCVGYKKKIAFFSGFLYPNSNMQSLITLLYRLPPFKKISSK